MRLPETYPSEPVLIVGDKRTKCFLTDTLIGILLTVHAISTTTLSIRNLIAIPKARERVPAN